MPLSHHDMEHASLPALVESHFTPAAVPLPLPLRVMVVDDNRDAADSTALLLRMCGAKALACYDAKEALAAVEWFRPDACVLDINMPGLNGYDLAQLIRSWFGDPHPTLVALTAVSDPAAKARAMKAGFVRHLTKPAEPRALLAALVANLP